jgi:BASS family bile acid:Na+ symporter
VESPQKRRAGRDEEAIGLLLGGRDPATRRVIGLGTAQRNIAAAVLVATVSFSGTLTLPFILVASIILPLVLLPTAKRMGKRADARGAPTEEAELTAD